MQRARVVVYHLVAACKVSVIVQVPLLHRDGIYVSRRIRIPGLDVIAPVKLFQALPVALAAPQVARGAVQVAGVAYRLDDAPALRIIVILRNRGPRAGLVLLDLDDAVFKIVGVFVIAVARSLLGQVARGVVAQVDLRAAARRPVGQLVDLVVAPVLGGAIYCGRGPVAELVQYLRQSDIRIPKLQIILT